MAVKLFNQGKRIIHGEDMDEKGGFKTLAEAKEAGKLKPFAFRPKTALSFSDETAKKLKKIYGNEMLAMDEIKNQFDDAPEASKAAPERATPSINKPVDDLAVLSAQERELVVALRAQEAQKATDLKEKNIGADPTAPAPQSDPRPDPSKFVNVTEEEGKAALAAIQAVREKNAAQPQSETQSLIESVRQKIANLANTGKA